MPVDGWPVSGSSSTTLPRVLAAAADRYPDREFVVADDGTASYAEVARSSVRTAAALTRLGLRPGDRIGVMLPNGLRWCTAVLAAYAAGLSVVPLNTWFKASELRDTIRRSGLRAVVTQRTVFGTDIASMLQEAAAGHYVRILFWEPGSPAPAGIPDEAVDSASTSVLARAPGGPDSEALLVFTSGSTAEPKGVRLLQGGLVAQGQAVGDRQGVRAGDRFWLAIPLFFVFGCANALPNALTHAATLCIQERFDAESALAFIEQQRCTVYYAVGPMTRALAASPALTRHDISSLRTGTANATPEDLRLAIEVLGVSEVCNAYGLTEGYGHSTITSHDDPPEVRMTTQGQPLPTQQLRIATGTEPVSAGEAGEIQIRGTITPGYLDDALGASRFTADGWFRTGDLGCVDAGGRLHYLGRSTEMIKIKGISVSPAELEATLVEHPDVDQAFIFGVPTLEGDEAVGCALVTTIPQEGHEALSAAVRAWLRARVASYKVPTVIRVMRADELPLTATGKVAKRELRDRALPS